MKKFIALLLAVLLVTSLIACNNTADDQTDGTTTAASTTPAVTTKPNNNNVPPVTGPVAEKPQTGLYIADVFSFGLNLQQLIDTSSITLANMTPATDAEGVDKLFNGTIVGDKLYGTVNGTVEITWKTTAPTTVSTYALFTGNDSAETGRLPYSWEFFGSNDNGATWTSLDKVEISGVTKANDTPFGYFVDSPAAYTSYKLAVTAVSEDGTAAGGTALQMNEFIIIGEGAGTVAETPVTDTTELDAMRANGTDLTSTVKDPYVENASLWGDGAAIHAFDGDYTSTKVGGNGQGLFNLYWNTDVATTVKNYIIYTGNDSEKWSRVPQSWVLFGSNDEENWIILDYVSESGIPKTSATPYGYTVDNPNSFTHYALVIMTVTEINTDNVIAPGMTQINELVLIGDKAAS